MPSFQVEACPDVLTMKNASGMNALHYGARSNSVEALETFISLGMVFLVFFWVSRIFFYVKRESECESEKGGGGVEQNQG